MHWLWGSRNRLAGVRVLAVASAKCAYAGKLQNLPLRILWSATHDFGNWRPACTHHPATCSNSYATWSGECYDNIFNMITIISCSINWIDSMGFPPLLSYRYFWLKYDDIRHTHSPNLSACTSIKFTKIVLHHPRYYLDLLLGSLKLSLLLLHKLGGACKTKCPRSARLHGLSNSQTHYLSFMQSSSHLLKMNP